MPDSRKSRRPFRRPVTLDDVAARAGFSRITVSRALQSSPAAVSAPTREAIENAARALGYVPNLAASTLSSRRSGLVVALVPTISTSTFLSALAELRTTLVKRDLQLLVGDSGYTNETEGKILRSVLGRRPDALVLFSATHSLEAKALIDATNTMVVEAWDFPGSGQSPTVGFDNREAGSIAARHLLERDRRRLAFVTSPITPRTVGGQRANRRWQGFASAVRALLGRDPDLVVVNEPLTYAGGRAATRTLLQAYPDVDAAFFAYDEWAAGGLFECQASHVDVPETLAICGFGGLPISLAIEPRLTTVAIPMKRLGESIGRKVLQLLDGGPVKRRSEKVPLELVIGSTT